MTNKQIIIDGVDVSECESFSRTERQVTIEEDCVQKCLIVPCNAISNCYYKQLQRLKAENQRLKDSNQAWGFSTAQLRGELEALKAENSGLNNRIADLINKLNELQEAQDE